MQGGGERERERVSRPAIMDVYTGQRQCDPRGNVVIRRTLRRGEREREREREREEREDIYIYISSAIFEL